MPTVHPAITTDFLRSLVEKYNDDVNNLKFSITPLSAGENYTSAVYQIQINYTNSGNQNKELYFVIKVSVENDFLSGYVKIMKFFETEIDIYTRILPRINSLEHLKHFSARLVYASLTPHPCLVFEDLTKVGYKMQCRHKGLDLDHCLIVIEKLAYLHASSMAIKEQETLTNFNQGIYWNNDYSINWINVGLESLIQACTNIKHLNKYATKLQFIRHKFVENVFASTKNSSICNVLNHGDCWTNNLMFSYNQDGSVKDVVLLDLQLCFYSSPVIDLHFFWATSPNRDVLTNHFNDITDYYYKQFVANLQKFGIEENVPSKLELLTDFKEKAIYGLNTLLTLTPFIKVDKRPDANLENYYKYFDKNSFRYDCYNNKRYLERITHLLPFYDNFDVFQ
ncbi:hypothetical protein FQR65_LT10000 [Abscondita terminalis]|nr:hypothetical protein FQR65_LT10000 [Abscondita terminalis]